MSQAASLNKDLLFFHLNIQSSRYFFQADAKRKITEEEDNFTREVTEFNNEYGLTSNRDILIKKKVKTEINDLENEAALLKNGKSYIKTVYLGLTQTNKIQLCKPVILISFPHCLELPFRTELKEPGLTYQA